MQVKEILWPRNCDYARPCRFAAVASDLWPGSDDGGESGRRVRGREWAAAVDSLGEAIVPPGLGRGASIGAAPWSGCGMLVAHGAACAGWSRGARSGFWSWGYFPCLRAGLGCNRALTLPVRIGDVGADGRCRYGRALPVRMGCCPLRMCTVGTDGHWRYGWALCAGAGTLCTGAGTLCAGSGSVRTERLGLGVGFG